MKAYWVVKVGNPGGASDLVIPCPELFQHRFPLHILQITFIQACFHKLAAAMAIFLRASLVVEQGEGEFALRVPASV